MLFPTHLGLFSLAFHGYYQPPLVFLYGGEEDNQEPCFQTQTLGMHSTFLVGRTGIFASFFTLERGTQSAKL